MLNLDYSGRLTMQLFYRPILPDRLEKRDHAGTASGFIVLTYRYIYSASRMEKKKSCSSRVEPSWIRSLYRIAMVLMRCFIFALRMPNNCPRVLMSGRQFDFCGIGNGHASRSNFLR